VQLTPLGAVAGPELAAASVQDRRPDVRDRLGRVVEVAPPAVQAAERVLHDVFGRDQVAEHDDGELDEADRVRLVQRGDVSGGSRQGRAHHFDVRT